MLWQAFGRFGGVMGAAASDPDPNPGHGSFTFDGVNDTIEMASAPVTTVPCTIVGWMKSPDDATRCIGGLFNDTVTGMFQIAKHTNPVQDVSAEAWNGGTGGLAGGGNFPLSTWCHVAGIFTNATSRAVYLDGTQVATNSTSVTPAGINRVVIGANIFAGVEGAFFDGQLAHFAIWNIVLSGADITSLAAGARPDTIQAGNLVFYAPLVDGVAKDLVSNASLTVSGAVSSSSVSPAGS